MITEQQICKEKSVSELSAWVLLFRYIPFYNIIKLLFFFTFISPTPTSRLPSCYQMPWFLVELWVWIPPGAWMSVSCECCVLSGRGLCNGLIASPEESYRVWCVWVWLWSLDNEEALAHKGLWRRKIMVESATRCESDVHNENYAFNGC